jgi:hypothetical protein
MTETDAVAVNDKGEYVDSETGRVLTEDEVKDIKEKTTEQTSKKDSGKEDTTEAKNGGGKKEENTTEKPKKETTTEAPKGNDGGKKEEGTTQKPKQESTTEKPKENNTEAPKKETTTEAKTEAKKEEACSHDWVWKTHTVHHDAVTHTENHYGEAWDEAVYVQKVMCGHCKAVYENDADYHARDNCGGSYGHVDVVDHYIHHEPELLWSEEIVDKEAYDEEVKDYQYCSKCGQKK